MPPLAGAVQISPPETKAISALSGEREGSARVGRGAATPCAARTIAIAKAKSPMTRRGVKEDKLLFTSNYLEPRLILRQRP